MAMSVLNWEESRRQGYAKAMYPLEMVTAAFGLEEFLGCVPCVPHKKGFEIDGEAVRGCHYLEMEYQASYIYLRDVEVALVWGICILGCAVTNLAAALGYSDSMNYHGADLRHMETLGATKPDEVTDFLPRSV